MRFRPTLHLHTCALILIFCAPARQLSFRFKS
jgi:hypothetical protein